MRLPRARRDAILTEHAAGYAQWLSQLLVESPYDWFNFYDFWGRAAPCRTQRAPAPPPSRTDLNPDIAIPNLMPQASQDFSFEITLSAAFHDLDPMNVVWHGNYVRYFEQARCALLARYHYDYPAMRDSGYAWPVVDMRVKYVGPLTYGQSFIVRATIVEWENRLKISMWSAMPPAAGA